MQQGQERVMHGKVSIPVDVGYLHQLVSIILRFLATYFV